MDHLVVTVDANQTDTNDHLALESRAQDMDIHMDNEMHELHDSDHSDAHEVEMQMVHNDETAPHIIPHPTQLPTQSSLPPSRTSRRRPRLVDDEDDGRDRRHPSQRIVQPASNPSSSTSSGLHAPLPQNPASIPRSVSAPQVQTQHHTPNTPQHVFHAMFNMGGRIDQPFRFFQHMMPNNPGIPENNDNVGVDNGNNNPTPTAPPQQIPLQPPQPQQNGNATFRPPAFFGGLALSFNLAQLGVASLQPPPPPPAPAPVQTGAEEIESDRDQEAPANPDQPPHPNEILADLFGRLRESVGHPGFNIAGGIPVNINFGAFGLGLDAEREDPDRARKLVDGLDEVPVGLVRRLVRVGGTGGGMGHDETQGGDAGCAVCWDTLLDSEGAGFGKPDGSSAEASASMDSSSKDDSRSKQPKIISLPCAHVFHADCLIPWFSRPRQTTCPTCRFNVDPQNLTYVPWSTRQREREEAEDVPTTEPAPGTSAQPANPEDGNNNHSDTFDQGTHNDITNLPLPVAAAQAPAEITEPNPPATTAASAPGEARVRPPGFPPAASGQRQTTTTFRTPNGIISFTQLLPVSVLDVNVPGRIPNAVNVDQAQAPDRDPAIDGQQSGALPTGDGQASPAPQQPQPPANQPQQPMSDFLANLDPVTARAIAATDRAIVDVFSRLFGDSPEQPPQPVGQPPAGGQEGQSQTLPQPQQQPPESNAQPSDRTQPLPQFRLFANLSNLFGGLQERDDGPKPPWTLPPAPGPTLRQRIERREREAGVRCCDVSCGVGPSDEDPELNETTAVMKQLPIMEKDGVGSEICLHRFHGSCLVSATRVALKGADTAVEGGNVEVSCPVCRCIGCVSKEQWDEGVAALQ